MTLAYVQILRTVRRTRRQWQTQRVIEGLLCMGIVWVMAIMLAAAADQWQRFDSSGRWIAAGLVWGLTLLVGWRFLARPALEHHTDDFFAALLEDRFALGNRFINAFQLGGRQPLYARSARLIAHIVDDGAALVEKIDPATAVSSPVLVRAAAGLAIVLMLTPAIMLLGGPALRTSLWRIVMPGAPIAPFSFIHLHVSFSPRGHVLQGEAIHIHAHAAGPTAAAVHYTIDGQSPQLVPMTAEGVDSFLAAVPASGKRMSFYITAGDAASATQSIVVDARPAIASAKLTYHYPSYTALPPRTVSAVNGRIHGLKHTRVVLTLDTNKPLKSLSLRPKGGQDIPAQLADATAEHWRVAFTIDHATMLQFTLADTQGYTVTGATKYSVTVDDDAKPAVAIVQPGRDLTMPREQTLALRIQASDDYGLGELKLMGAVGGVAAGRGVGGGVHAKAFLIQKWTQSGKPRKRIEQTYVIDPHQLHLRAGDQLTYWAVAADRNDVTGPGVTESHRYHVSFVSSRASERALNRNLKAYANLVNELIRLQQLNRDQTSVPDPPGPLIDRQVTIRGKTQSLVKQMQRDDFPAVTMIQELSDLASGPMAKVVVLLEGYRDANEQAAGMKLAGESLPVQDAILNELKRILLRLNKAEQVRAQLRRKRKKNPAQAKAIEQQLGKVESNLDKFLAQLADAKRNFEKMPKDADRDRLDSALKNAAPPAADTKKISQWMKDSVDAIAKLPDGFVASDSLLDDVNTIFEEVQKQPRGKTHEVAVPMEGGAKALAEETKEDLEMWMPHAPDSTKWVMEDPMEGKFQVPATPLPDNLQDEIGNLLQKADQFDKNADDTTSSWGGNMQAGWGISDGPMSDFAARGKTGNTLPNNNELSGRSGSGRRGRSSGQSVGSTSKGLEGRPTPARVTNEPYDKGSIKAEKQLNPDGSTGGGKMTGGGQEGLQGGTPPNMVKDMARITRAQQILREKTEQIAHQLAAHGRPLDGVDHAIALMDASDKSYRDMRYADAAHQRELAIAALKQAMDQSVNPVNVAMDEARRLPPAMRAGVMAGMHQPMPAGYGDLVSAYYQALSEDAQK